jgi:riboflavin biosynthesis pyrimidine reductase
MSAVHPTVLVSYAQSLDGKIAMLSGQSQWISGPDTLNLAHELRGESDAILVGVGTVLSDDPELTCRLSECQSPVRVILDSRLRTPLDSRIAQTAKSYETVVLTTTAYGNSERARSLEALGVRVETVPEETEPEESTPAAENASAETASISVPAVYERLGALGHKRLFIEGGSRVITAFYRAGLIHRVVLVIAPILIGEGIPAVGELGIARMKDAMRLQTVRQTQMGEDLVWELTSHG